MDVNKKSVLVLYFTLVFCVANFVLTVFLVRSPCGSRQVSEASKPLPGGLKSLEERMEFFNRVSTVYNSGSSEEMMEMLDPMARVQVPSEQMIAQIDSLKNLIGQISDGAYSHYEVVNGLSQGLQMYRLHYVLKLENGKGDMTLTIGQQGDKQYRFIGFHLNKAE